MAKISRGKFRWLRDEYAFRQWKKWFIADVGEAIGNIKVGDLVKEVATKGYYDGNRRITGEEFDLETYFQISKMENPTFLTIHRGKHKHEPSPGPKLYTVMDITSVEASL